MSRSQHPGGSHPQGHAHGSAGVHGSAGDHEHHGTDVDWGRMADQLETGGEVQLPVLRRVAERLRDLVEPGVDVRRVLDVGSGPGVMTCVLAETFTGAEVVAVDGAPALLDRAAARGERLGLGGRVSTRHAELPEGFQGDGLGAADVVWSSKAVHHLGDQQQALDLLAGTLRPGGVLAVAEGGLPARFLPRDIGVGRPGLHARLDLLEDTWFATMRAGLPGSVAVVEDWPAMLRHAGLDAVTSFTLVLDLPAPLEAQARTYLHGHLSRLREVAAESLDAVDLDALDVLLDPDSPAGILRRPDAFLLAGTTVFAGVRPPGRARRVSAAG